MCKAVSAPCCCGACHFSRWRRSRQDLEQDYYREWETTTVLAAEEGKRKMTAVTLLAFLPTFFKFYLVSRPQGGRHRHCSPWRALLA